MACRLLLVSNWCGRWLWPPSSELTRPNKPDGTSPVMCAGSIDSTGCCSSMHVHSLWFVCQATLPFRATRRIGSTTSTSTSTSSSFRYIHNRRLLPIPDPHAGGTDRAMTRLDLSTLSALFTTLGAVTKSARALHLHLLIMI